MTANEYREKADELIGTEYYCEERKKTGIIAAINKDLDPVVVFTHDYPEHMFPNGRYFIPYTNGPGGFWQETWYHETVTIKKDE